MKIQETKIAGCYLLELNILNDARGSFIKTYHEPTFGALGLETKFDEEYYSISRKGVLRGLHFQAPPHDHTKIINCSQGEVFDVVLDLRKYSTTYGEYQSFILNGSDARMLYLSPGLAHGFYVISDEATVTYKVTTVYDHDYDTGVRWDSAAIEWPDNNPIISDRDRNLPHFNDFTTPFVK
ncbi:dTDP-4-dehydrorhamnose 3,5-epimerase [candidate division KSB1 bacterium]|nr:dTDP-4-dehydrorhamnose 3,5-epimerase [candidate division KSB1 bacterium]